MSEKMVKVRDLMSPEFVARMDWKVAEAKRGALSIFDPRHATHCVCAAAEDHSERMTPYEGDAGDETDGMEHCV